MRSSFVRWSAVVATGCLSVAACATQAVASDQQMRALVVQLDTGRIRGLNDGTVRTYTGIRYAQPPVGELRWKKPVPAKPWKGVADATKPAPKCVQAEGGKQIGKEDCLFLNVTAPAKPSRKKLPVMVWMHGGGYTTGSGGDYGARRMADQGDVVVVTINYRLGAFGLLGLSGLPGSGTFMLADQLEALRWVKRNAAAFGGDTGNVTMLGESAGGMSTCALLTSPATRGLVDKAVVQSGSCMIEWRSGTYIPIPGMPSFTPYTSLKANHATGEAAAKKLGCAAGKELECLRDKPVSELMKVNDTFASNLAYGTPLLPLEPAQALRKGKFLRVPVLSGGTKDEANGFIAGAIKAGYPVTAENYPKLVKGAFGEKAGAVLKKYPLSDYRSPGLAWATVSNDSSWACPTLAGDRAMTARTKVYAYEFADAKAPNIGDIPAGFPPGAQHASELPYLFDLGGRPWPGLTSEQWRLAGQMVGYWTSFAHTGKPRAQGAPAWPAFGRAGTVLSLKPKSQGGVGPARYDREHHCGFWRGITG
ncbi:carboxylesterase [Nonomuraea longispora]|uniref:Carboxylesterase n=1 Tax=Nonomuraea longispora TaxID=1848320 RepID=A0A4R4N6W6_9ACTN|nr:carboxylesterase family protein [Nonomuraea longispora]TDC02092.1 carboxylesterase [Nonomuraea longispora]